MSRGNVNSRRAFHDGTDNSGLNGQRQYRLERQESGFVLNRVEARVVQPGPHQILVKVRAVSLNRRDTLIRAGRYPVAVQRDSFVPCSDAAGDVVAIGPDVTRFRVGDRVMSVFMPGWLGGTKPADASASSLGAGGVGMLTDYVIVNEEALVKAPASLSYESAATLPCAGVTAWNALVELGRVAKGETVLIQGTGGVSLFALQIASAFGAIPVVISASDDKLACCRAMGVTRMLNYVETPDWAGPVRELTGGRGVDQIVDVGGEATLAQSFAALASGGHIALVGGLGGFPRQLPAMDIILKAARVSGVSVGSRDHLEGLAAFVELHHLAPVIDRRFAFEDAEAAYRRLDAPDLLGNVIISN